MRQICPKCNNWVAGSPHVSLQDKIGKAAIKKSSAQVVGGAVGLVFGPLGGFAGSVIGSVIADNYSGKIIQTKEYDFACPKCGYQWVSANDTVAEQQLDVNLEVTRCKCCNSVNADDAKVCTSCGTPIIKDGIYTLLDIIQILNEKSDNVSEQTQSLIVCQLLVIGFLQENTSKSIEFNYVNQFFSSAVNTLSICNGRDFEVSKQILNKMVQTIVTAKYAKMLHQNNKTSIPSDINESLKLLKDTITFVFQLIEGEIGEEINWVDNELKSAYYTMQKGNELLFGPNPIHRPDEYNPTTQKAITVMEKFLLSLRQPLKESGLSLEQYKERYFTLLYQELEQSLPTAPKIETIKKTRDMILIGYATVASPLCLYIGLWFLHILAYMFYYMTFTLLKLQNATGNWIDTFSAYWFVMPILIAGIGVGISFVKWNKLANKNLENQQKYTLEVEKINKYNDELKKRIQEEMDNY